MTDRPDLARAWRAQIITLFPEAFPGVLGESLTGKALKDGIWQLDTIGCATSARASIAMSTTRPRAAARAWCCAPT